MTISQRQLGLLPEGADQCRASLHGAQSIASAARQVVEGAGTVVSEFVMLEMAPTARPFIVEAGSVFVRATGTKFGVQRLSEQVVVTVLDGTVVVTRPESSSTMVTAGAGEQVSGSALWPAAVRRVDAARELAWANRQLIFEGATVAEIVDAFNRRNRLQIDVEPVLAARAVYGVFEANDPESFVRSLATTRDVVWQRTGDSLQVQTRSGKRRTSRNQVKP